MTAACEVESSMCPKVIRVRLGGVVFASFMLVVPYCTAADWEPQKNVEIITGASPGGGNDTLARRTQKILQDKRLISVTSTVINKVGGGNSLSWVYLNQHAGDGHYLAIVNPNFLTNYITGKNTQHYADFTPVVMLLSEYVVIAVRADSPIKNGKDFIERLKKDPGSLNITVGSALGNANHIAIAQATKALGGDIKKLRPVVFGSTGEGIIALLGGHIDVLAGSASNVVPYLKAEKLRVITTSAPRRQEGLFAQVPTWKEQGIEVTTGNWRGFIGPKGMSGGQVAYWEEVFARFGKTAEWKKEVDTYLYEDFFLKSTETRRFLETENSELKSILTDLGLAR